MRVAQRHMMALGVTAVAVALLALTVFAWRLARIMRMVRAEQVAAARLGRETTARRRISREAAMLDTAFQTLDTTLELLSARWAAADHATVESDLAWLLNSFPHLEGSFYHGEPRLVSSTMRFTEGPGTGWLRTPQGGLVASSPAVAIPDLVIRDQGQKLQLLTGRRGTGEPVVIATRPAGTANDRSPGRVTVIWSQDGFTQMLLAAIHAEVAPHHGTAALVGERGKVLGEIAEISTNMVLAAGQEQARRQRVWQEPTNPNSLAVVVSRNATQIQGQTAAVCQTAYHPLSALDPSGGKWWLERSWSWSPSDAVSGDGWFGMSPQNVRAVLVSGVAIAATAMFIFLAIMAVITRHTFYPLAQALDFSRYLARGDFSRDFRTRRHDDFGELAKTLNFLRDRQQNAITRLKQSHQRERQARRELETADRLRSDFLAHMSNDLKTPLSFILSVADTLRAEAQSGRLPQPVATQAETLHEHATRLYELISNLLSLSRLESQQIVARIGEFETSAFLRELLDLHQHATEARDVYLQCEYSDNLPTVINTDRALLMNLLSALLTDLIQTAKPGAAVTMGCETGAHELTFWVRGAPSAERKSLAELYNQYTRLDPALMPYYGGQAVLRMAIAKAHAQLLHAELTGETLDDQVSLFRVIFRKSDVVFYAATETSSIHIATNWRQELRHSRSPADQRIRVLVADADTVARARVQEMLRDAEIDTQVVGNGKDCLELLHREEFDLLLVDLAVPRVSARRIVAHLQDEPNFRRMPIVVMADNLKPEEQERLQAAGVKEFLRKPIEIEDLIRTISAMVE